GLQVIVMNLNENSPAGLRDAIRLFSLRCELSSLRRESPRFSTMASGLRRAARLDGFRALRLTSPRRCATIAAMSKPKDNNPSRGDLIRLTARCKAAGCAGKLGPADLSAVLARLELPSHPDLLVGISTGDDAGVFRLSDDLAIVNTVDFFTPVVDDPFTYGQISAANALSDVYAMGGVPRTALNIVCWPQTGLPGAMLAEILGGAADKAREAGVVIVGGHTVADEEVKFGMAITGVIDPRRIVRNVGAQVGDALVLSKALGTGILLTAFKRDKLGDEPYNAAVRSMTQLNAAAASAMLKYEVHAATDITGFGLVGHALKMAEGSGVT